MTKAIPGSIFTASNDPDCKCTHHNQQLGHMTPCPLDRTVVAAHKYDDEKEKLIARLKLAEEVLVWALDKIYGESYPDACQIARYALAKWREGEKK